MFKYTSILTWSSKKAAYCAIFMGLAGCTSQNSIINAQAQDPLALDKVRVRANQISNLPQAKALEAQAMARQQLADAQLVNIEQFCVPKFLVNKCIEDARDKRNNEWDSAQLDLTTARYYIRMYEANEQQAKLAQKLADYNAEQVANAPVRAANAAAFVAKNTAQAQRIAVYTAEQMVKAPERALKASQFEEKQKTIEAIKKKRLEDAAKRAAKKAAEDAKGQ